MPVTLGKIHHATTYHLLTLAKYMEIIKIVNFTALGLKAVPRMIDAKTVLLFLAVHMTP